TTASASSPAKESKPENKAVASSPSATGQVVEMVVKPLGESITEVVLGSWVKNDGDLVQLDEVLAEIESDKATFELTAEAAGVLRIKAQAGDTLKVGDLICKIEVMEGATANTASSPASTPASSSGSKEQVSEEGYAKQHASPAASKILTEKGIDNSEVKGTGVGGRITKEDALKAEKAAKSSPATETKATESKAVAATGARHQERQKMTSLRKTIAKRLVAVKNETAMLTTFNEVDMRAVMELRKRRKDSFKERYGVNLGFMSFFTRAVVGALKAFPLVNAEIQGDEVVIKHYYDIGVAVGVEEGLVVPVVRDADRKSFAAIEREIGELAKKAREGTLGLADLQGGTFTITNGGVYGSLMSTPILNAPQVGILGMHKIEERAVVIKGEIAVRPMMYLALSYDHRLIDGGTAVRFLVRIKELLEDPEALLLEG
ncbi:MAG: 2-oxoglutarate dehydrogenase complex dihydrolipoyllysine-residue succinyltransferase, partial [Oscillochloris sp.]|nr:2-oxoglutarate dehydrogenase complex dihydrolipoyllysine-residue succinyltransferase [Oscillochloris sp.]